MSFSMTTPQFQARTKTVTRRLGWKFLKAGDLVNGVKKAMGLKEGEKIKSLGVIRIVSTRWEPLCAITHEDVELEGFPSWGPEEFVRLLVDKYKIERDHLVNRIEFEHMEAQ